LMFGVVVCVQLFATFRAFLAQSLSFQQFKYWTFPALFLASIASSSLLRSSNTNHEKEKEKKKRCIVMEKERGMRWRCEPRSVRVTRGIDSPHPPLDSQQKNKKWKMKTNRKEKTTTVFSRFIIPFFVFFVFFFVHCTFLNDHKRRLSALVDRRTHLDSRRWNSFSWIIPSIFSGSFVFWCFPPNPKRRRRKRINKMKFRWFSL
jgi:hypothetical protein